MKKMIRSVIKLVTKLRPLKRGKVFGIGFPKTGTTTLGSCLKTWGYKHYDCNMNLAAEVCRNETSNALKIAKRYESFEDWPWFMLYKELDQEFANSKFILTVRKDTQTYISSVKNTINAMEDLKHTSKNLYGITMSFQTKVLSVTTMNIWKNMKNITKM